MNKEKARKLVKTFPLIQWVGFKGDTKKLKKLTGASSVTRAIEEVIKEKINSKL